MKTEEMVLVLFAATNGYIDDLPVSACLKFQDEMLRFMKNRHPAILTDVAEKKAIDDALRARIAAALDELKKEFVA
jgi:F-type H+-transporting ATPase subunit alpha